MAWSAQETKSPLIMALTIVSFHNRGTIWIDVPVGPGNADW